MKRCVTRARAARILGVHTITIKRWCEKGLMEHEKRGSTILVHLDAELVSDWEKINGNKLLKTRAKV